MGLTNLVGGMLASERYAERLATWIEYKKMGHFPFLFVFKYIVSYSGAILPVAALAALTVVGMIVAVKGIRAKS